MKDTYLLRVFGRPQLLDDVGQHIGFKTRRQLAILVFLVLEGHGKAGRRARIAELFWPGVDEVRAGHSLSQAVSDIRRVLGRDAISSRDGCLALSRPIETELERFANDADSLADLAEPLQGMEDLGGVTLSHWLDAARTDLNNRLRDVLQHGLAEKRAGGDMIGVRERAELLYRADPMNDEAVLALAEDALLHGDAPTAVHLLRAHASRLRESCGGNPGADVVRLMRVLEGGNRAEVPMDRPVHMVGREQEMASLQGVWDGIRGGGSASALITGVPGIGKTTLIENFLFSLSARKWHCYSIRCHEMGSRIPYTAIADLVHLLAAEPSVAGTDPVLLAEASRVAPELNAIYPGIPEPPRTDPDSIRLRVAGALYQMLDEVADGGPVLVTFDDIHNMDQASRDVFYVLYHRMRSRAAMFLGSARSPEDGRVVSRSDVLDWDCIIELGPLDRSLSRELLERIPGSIDSRTAQRILELGQDNPHLIEILAADARKNGKDALVEIPQTAGGWRWRASDTMNRALAGLLFGLRAEAQRLLDLLSIMERPLSIADAAAITNTEEKSATRAGFELIERGLVRFESRGLAIKNELHRFYIHSRMNPDIRRFLHARVARHVTTTIGPESSLELVHHLIGADSVVEAKDRVAAAARQALRQGAPAEAEKAIRASATIPDVTRDPEVKLLLAKALVATGKYQEAIRTLETPEHYQAVCTNGEAGRLLAEALFRSGRTDDGRILSLTQDALSLTSAADDPVEVANTLQLLAEVAFFTGQDALVESAAKYAGEIAQKTDLPDAAGKLNLTNGFYAMVAGEIELAVEKFELARKQLGGLPPDTSYRRALNGLGMCYTGLGMFPFAESVLRSSLVVSEQIGDVTGIGNSSDTLGCLLFELGRYDEANTCFRRCLATRDKDLRPGIRANSLSNAVLLAITLGRFDEAKDLAKLSEENASRSRFWHDQVGALLAWADYYLATKNSGAAWDVMEEVRSICNRNPSKLATDRGQLGRLIRHHTFATKGWPALQEEVGKATHADYSRVTNRLEIQLFETWAACDVGEKGAPLRGKRLVKEATSLGLYGTLAKLHAVGSLPFRLGGRTGESSADLVTRTLHHVE